MAGVVDEDAADQVGGKGEELGAARPVESGMAVEPQIGLMDDGGGLQGMPSPLAAQLLGGDAPQLVVDQRQNLLRGLLIAAAPALQQASDLLVLSHDPLLALNDTPT